jgi:hypothetical protein
VLVAVVVVAVVVILPPLVVAGASVYMAQEQAVRLAQMQIPLER